MVMAMEAEAFVVDQARLNPASVNPIRRGLSSPCHPRKGPVRKSEGFFQVCLQGRELDWAQWLNVKAPRSAGVHLGPATTPAPVFAC